MAGLYLCICSTSQFLSFCKPSSERFHRFGKLVLVSPALMMKREHWSFVATGHTPRDGLSGDETCSCREQVLGSPMSEMEMESWPQLPTESEFKSGYTGSSSVTDQDACYGDKAQHDQGWTDMIEELAWDPYLGDIKRVEKDEEPPLYVPAPPIPLEDMDMQSKVETLLYTMKELLPGCLDMSKVEAVRSLLSTSVEVQNPLVCYQGIDRLDAFLRVLCKAELSIDLHDIYYENLMMHPKGSQQSTMKFGMHDSISRGLDLEDAGKITTQSPTDSVGPESQSHALEGSSLKLSGESVLEMDKSGLATRISSTWYVMQEEGEASFAAAKHWLSSCIQKSLR